MFVLSHVPSEDHREKYLVHDLGPDMAEHEHVDGPEQPQVPDIFGDRKINPKFPRG